jgi:hypothetical protein
VLVPKVAVIVVIFMTKLPHMQDGDLSPLVSIKIRFLTDEPGGMGDEVGGGFPGTRARSSRAAALQRQDRQQFVHLAKPGCLSIGL